MKTVTIADFLTPEEISAAVALYKKHPHSFASRCKETIIAPVIDRINKDLGQENDPGYLAYAVEYVFMKTVQ